jgi:CTP synthase
MAAWRDLVRRQTDAEERGKPVTIAIVGKYLGNPDSYLSVVKALQHAAVAAGRKLQISWVDSSLLEDDSTVGTADDGTVAADRKAARKSLEEADGVLVPGGFGDRGIGGKVDAAKYARESRVPYFGVCLGMQIAVIEFARNVLGWASATSTEFDADARIPVVIHMPELQDEKQLGGTLRLGLKSTQFRVPLETSIVAQLYGGHNERIEERHRHRYEVNPSYVPLLEAKGLRFVAQDATRTRMEIIELARDVHPYFVGCQFHPEFLSAPLKPSPLYVGFIDAAISHQQQQQHQTHHHHPQQQ